MDDEQVNEQTDLTTRDPVDKLLNDKQPPPRGRGLAIVALLLALGAGAASGWLWWQEYNKEKTASGIETSVVDLEQKQQALEQTIDRLGQRLDAAAQQVDPGEFARLQSHVRELAGELDGMKRQTAGQKSTEAALQGSVRSLEQRLATTESGLASLAANSQNSAVDLAIEEIDFLLRVASERLQLFADPKAADEALQAADVQIAALKDPLFLSVRQRIADARSALAAVPEIDRVKLSARLSDLQKDIGSLAFSGDNNASPPSRAQADEGWWQSFKRSLASLVTVRRRVPGDRSRLTIADREYLRQGIWLQLESARLALMRRDADAYQASLQRVEATLKQFFDPANSAVKAMQHAVGAMEQIDIAPPMPDISAPWLQLRQLRDSRRLLRSAPAPASGGDDKA